MRQEAKAYVASSAASILKGMDATLARHIAAELKDLPTLEGEAVSPVSIPGIGDGYRGIVLPSGYLAVYRELSDLEKKEMPGGYSADPAYLVADLVLLVDARAVTTVSA